MVTQVKMPTVITVKTEVQANHLCRKVALKTRGLILFALLLHVFGAAQPHDGAQDNAHNYNPVAERKFKVPIGHFETNQLKVLRCCNQGNYQ